MIRGFFWTVVACTVMGLLCVLAIMEYALDQAMDALEDVK